MVGEQLGVWTSDRIGKRGDCVAELYALGATCNLSLALLSEEGGARPQKLHMLP